MGIFAGLLSMIFWGAAIFLAALASRRHHRHLRDRRRFNSYFNLKTKNLTKNIFKCFESDRC
jgi:hypothetical protein